MRRSASRAVDCPSMGPGGTGPPSLPLSTRPERQPPGAAAVPAPATSPGQARRLPGAAQLQRKEGAACALPAAHCLLPTTGCPLPAAHCLLPSACCLLPAAGCPPPAAHRRLPTAGCPLPAVHRLLPTAHCWLPTAEGTGEVSVQARPELLDQDCLSGWHSKHGTNSLAIKSA